VPGYYCAVHHITDYAKCHTTDVNNLTFGCGTQRRLVRPGGWSTRKNANGDTEWIPPPHLERGQPRTNMFHHPEKLYATRTMMTTSRANPRYLVSVARIHTVT
jgi:hypothetical protein